MGKTVLEKWKALRRHRDLGSQCCKDSHLESRMVIIREKCGSEGVTVKDLTGGTQFSRNPGLLETGSTARWLGS